MRFLSDEWFEALGAALAEVTIPDDIELRVGQSVHDAPGGPVAYQFVLGGGRCVLEQGVDDATIVLHSSFDTASRIAAGQADAGSCILHGEVRVTGDPLWLVTAAPALAAIGPAVAAVRFDTVR